MDANAADLRYITADHLCTTRDGDLHGTSVVGPADTMLGTLAGALVDPAHRNVCYLVIESRNWLTKHSYLLPLGLTRFDQSRQALVVDANAADLEQVEMDRFTPFSDEDLIAAMFSPHAA